MLPNGTIILGDREITQTMCTRQYKWDYSKVMDPNIDYGSSCSIHRVKSGVIVKVPRRMWWSGGPDDVSDLGNHDKASFEREEKILDRLGVHPRIVQCVSHPDSRLLLRLDLTLIVILVSPNIPGGFYLRKQTMEHYGSTSNQRTTRSNFLCV